MRLNRIILATPPTLGWEGRSNCFYLVALNGMVIIPDINGVFYYFYLTDSLLKEALLTNGHIELGYITGSHEPIGIVITDKIATISYRGIDLMVGVTPFPKEDKELDLNRYLKELDPKYYFVFDQIYTSPSAYYSDQITHVAWQLPAAESIYPAGWGSGIGRSMRYESSQEAKIELDLGQDLEQYSLVIGVSAEVDGDLLSFGPINLAAVNGGFELNYGSLFHNIVAAGSTSLLPVQWIGISVGLSLIHLSLNGSLVATLPQVVGSELKLGQLTELSIPPGPLRQYAAVAIYNYALSVDELTGNRVSVAKELLVPRSGVNCNRVDTALITSISGEARIKLSEFAMQGSYQLTLLGQTTGVIEVRVLDNDVVKQRDFISLVQGEEKRLSYWLQAESKLTLSALTGSASYILQTIGDHS